MIVELATTTVRSLTWIASEFVDLIVNLMGILIVGYSVLSVLITCGSPRVHPTVAPDIADWCKGRPSKWNVVTVFCRNWSATMYDFHKAVCKVHQYLSSLTLLSFHGDSFAGQFYSSRASMQNI